MLPGGLHAHSHGGHAHVLPERGNDSEQAPRTAHAAKQEFLDEEDSDDEVEDSLSDRINSLGEEEVKMDRHDEVSNGELRTSSKTVSTSTNSTSLS